MGRRWAAEYHDLFARDDDVEMTVETGAPQTELGEAAVARGRNSARESMLLYE